MGALENLHKKENEVFVYVAMPILKSDFMRKTKRNIKIYNTSRLAK